MCVFVFRSRPRLSGGEKNYLLALSSIGVVGAILAIVVTLRLSAHGAIRIEVDAFTVWTAIAGCIGAMCGFTSVYSRWFGFPEGAGWIRALIGGLLLSGIGSVVAGTLILPYYGTMFAPFQLIIAMIEFPVLGLVWVAIIVCAHKLLEDWRAERESIFQTEEPLV